MDSGADIKGQWCEIRIGVFGGIVDDDVSPAFFGPTFHPIEILFVEDNVPETNGLRYDQLWRNGRFPGTVGSRVFGSGQGIREQTEEKVD